MKASLAPAGSKATPSHPLSDLLAEHGELVGGGDLQRCLGFKSARSFQRAQKEGRLPVTTFSLPGRRGVFARTRDIAAWLGSLGATA
jgi:hypothetical protein